MKYIIHFFKENNRNMDINQLLIFFSNYKEITTETKGDECYFHYQDNVLNNSFDFIFSQKSTILDLHKLSPKFLDVKFRFEVDPFIPSFKVKSIFDIVLKLTKTFDLYIYNYLLRDVYKCSYQALFATYQLFNKAYYRKNRDFLKDFIGIEETKLNTILRYQYEIKDLEYYFKDDDILVPEGRFVLDKNSTECLFMIDVVMNVNTVFPPYLDIIKFEYEGNDYYFDYGIIKEELSKILIYIPGALKDTNQINPKKIKKFYKYLVKNLKYSLNIELENITNQNIIEKISLDKE